MTTATEQRVVLDLELNKARQQAIQIVTMLEACIPAAARAEAIHFLTHTFYKHGVEITTKEQRAQIIKRITTETQGVNSN